MCLSCPTHCPRSLYTQTMSDEARGGQPRMSDKGTCIYGRLVADRPPSLSAEGGALVVWAAWATLATISRNPSAALTGQCALETSGMTAAWK